MFFFLGKLGMRFGCCLPVPLGESTGNVPAVGRGSGARCRVTRCRGVGVYNALQLGRFYELKPKQKEICSVVYQIFTWLFISNFVPKRVSLSAS